MPASINFNNGYEPYDCTGSKVCSSRAGTGINGGGQVFGDATAGNCQAMVKVSDIP